MPGIVDTPMGGLILSEKWMGDGRVGEEGTGEGSGGELWILWKIN